MANGLHLLASDRERLLAIGQCSLTVPLDTLDGPISPSHDRFLLEHTIALASPSKSKVGRKLDIGFQAITQSSTAIGMASGLFRVLTNLGEE